MIPVAFEFQKARTIDEAVAAISGSDGKILAGGHSLIPALKLRLSHPTKLVDISGIPHLKGIQEKNGEIIIGSACTHAEISNHQLIRDKLAFMAKGASLIGDPQVRNYGTIGGSLAHADPAADWPAMVLAAEADIEVQGPQGKRKISAKDFFTGFFSIALHEHELITAIHIPVPPSGTKSSYQKFIQPASRFAIVGCAVMRFPDGKTNIAFTGVSDHAFRDYHAEQFVNGKELTESAIHAAAEAAMVDVRIAGDHYASPVYRNHLAKAYLKKALREVS
jgi:carbon-monoxide dehydrogenase medium subunit